MMAHLTSPIWHGKIPVGSVGEAISFGDRLEIDIDGETYLVPYTYVEVLTDESTEEGQAGEVRNS